MDVAVDKLEVRGPLTTLLISSLNYNKINYTYIVRITSSRVFVRCIDRSRWLPFRKTIHSKREIDRRIETEAVTLAR